MPPLCFYIINKLRLCFGTRKFLEIILKELINRHIKFTNSIRAKEIIRNDGGVTSFNFEFTEWADIIEPLQKNKIIKEMKKNSIDDSLKDAEKLFAASGSEDKTLRVFSAEEGGAQHCQRDYLTLGIYTMWNWFEEKLVRN